MEQKASLSIEAAWRAVERGKRLASEGALDQAIEHFARVPRATGGAYIEAQIRWLLADFECFRVSAAAERVRVLLSEFPAHPLVLSEAGLVLHAAGDSPEAMECLRGLIENGAARSYDRYQLACVATKCERLDVARRELLAALAADPGDCVSAVLDPDLAPVWEALTEPAEAEAHALCGPVFDGVQEVALASIGKPAFNWMDALALPPDLQGMIRRIPRTWNYEVRLEFIVIDPGRVKRLRDEWERLARPRITVFARARRLAHFAVLAFQHDYAVAALARNNILAARWHVFHLLRHDPARLPELLGTAALAPLRPLLREIEAAFAVHPGVLDDSLRVIDEQELIEAKRAADAPGDLSSGLWAWRYAMLCDYVGDRERAILLFFELCRRWPDDACGYVNLSNSLAHLGRWDDAAAALAAAPKWYFASPHAESHIARIEARDISAPMFDLAPFRGQPDLGGLRPELSLSIP